jgi:predicted SnoaL-like aldol condensation-catalyzing enzyme/MFS family permease
MLFFAAANFVAWSASGYPILLAARILLALAAGLYVPSANALASAIVEPSRRGTALSIVTGGISVAVALGVPLGALVGDRFGWRLNFAAVGVLALIATCGLLRGLPRDLADRLPVASLRERLDVVRQPSVLLALLVTMLWATGAYTVYTYLASFLASAAEIAGPSVSAVLFMWGVAAVMGLRLGGRLTDRFRYLPVIVTSLSLLALAFLGLSTSAVLLPPAPARAPILLAIALWGVSAWSFFPAQQVRLISIAGVTVAPVALSLNASFQFPRLFCRCGSRFADIGKRLAPGARLGRCKLCDRRVVAHVGRRPARPRPISNRTLTRGYRRPSMSQTAPDENKALVLEAFDTLFNRRDYDAAERFWSDRYIQHSAHIPPGRDGLFNLVRTLPDTLKYENQLIVAEGDYVIAHGRFSGNGRPTAWIAADIVRIEDGRLAEHWDVLQDEATRAQSLSGLPMFGDRFPD